MRAFLSLIALLSALANLTPVAAQVTDDMSVEYKLAVVQRGRAVDQDDPLVFAFGSVLDRLTDRCQETRFQLGNGAVFAVTDLRKQGVYTETPLSILLGLDAEIPPDLNGPAKCAEFLGVLEYLLIYGN